ncbi:MAG: hypothetical protein V1736_03745 [Pseudomonadota bacterium]
MTTFYESIKIGFGSGERGIGKRSFVSFVRHLSDRESDAAGCHVFLGGVRELNEMVRRTFDRLLKESMDKPWRSRVREFFGDYVREVGLFGVSLELDLKGRDLSAITHDFVPAIRRLIDKLKGQKKSLLLILDDINGLNGCLWHCWVDYDGEFVDIYASMNKQNQIIRICRIESIFSIFSRRELPMLACMRLQVHTVRTLTYLTGLLPRRKQSPSHLPCFFWDQVWLDSWP